MGKVRNREGKRIEEMLELTTMGNEPVGVVDLSCSFSNEENDRESQK